MIKISKMRLAFLLLTVFILGSLSYHFIGLVRADAGDTNLIYGCVNNSTGNLRIEVAASSCSGGETELNWTKDSVNEIGNFGGYLTKNMGGYDGTYEESWDYRNFDGANFSGAKFFDPNAIGGTFVKSNYKSFNHASFINADFSNLEEDGTLFGIAIEANFTGADFTNDQVGLFAEGANFTDANFYSGYLNSGNLFGTASYIDADFTNANFTDANVAGVDLTQSIMTNAIWNNTVCSDETNSNDNSGTCEGHLAPLIP